jgi:acetyl esterase/lipase
MAGSSRHLIDPELLPALDLMPALDLDAARLDELRGGMEALIPPLETLPCDGVEIEVVSIPGPAGATFELQLFRPSGRSAGPLPALLHFHGGGYVLGNATQSALDNMRTAREVGCLVASVEYSLAPEACGTHAVEQCHAALLWLAAHASQLGIDAGRIAVGGESAGGGLAAALALLARDRGGVQPCFQLLIYPMLDSRTGRSEDEHPWTGEFIWTRSANRFGWDSLLGPGEGSAEDCHVVPARATDLSRLPPAYISVGALDLFLEENLEYARRLTRAGVPVELHVFPGAFHGFELAAEAGVSQRAETERRQALGRAFAA